MKQSDIARPLDGLTKLALVGGASTRRPPRLDLGALRDVTGQNTWVPVIDPVDLVDPV